MQAFWTDEATHWWEEVDRFAKPTPVLKDAVGAGIVDSLAHPGGNATGFMIYEYNLTAKYLELLKEIAPRVTRVAIIRNAANPGGIAMFGALQNAARSLGVETSPINVRDAREIERSVEAFARLPNGGLVVTQTANFFASRLGMATALTAMVLPHRGGSSAQSPVGLRQ